MCYFMFAISENQLDEGVLDKVRETNLYARSHESQKTGLPDGVNCYDICNGHCACEIVVSPFANSQEVKMLLSNLGSKGSFRFLVTNTEYEEIEDYFKAGDPKLKEEGKPISLEELLSIYPEHLEFEKVYNVHA